MGVSLFERMCKNNPDHTTILTKQYRMTNDILELANSIVYKGLMTHANAKVACQKIEFTQNIK